MSVDLRSATELPREDRSGLDARLHSGYLALIGLHRECAGSYPPGAQRQWHLLRAAVLHDDLQEWADLHGKIIIRADIQDGAA